MHQFVRTLLIAVVSALIVGLTAFPASATEPANWDSGEPMTTLEVLVLFVGAPVGLYIVITIFGYLMARNNYEPPSPDQ